MSDKTNVSTYAFFLRMTGYFRLEIKKDKLSSDSYSGTTDEEKWIDALVMMNHNLKVTTHVHER